MCIRACLSHALVLGDRAHMPWTQLDESEDEADAAAVEEEAPPARRVGRPRKVRLPPADAVVLAGEAPVAATWLTGLRMVDVRCEAILAVVVATTVEKAFSRQFP